MPMKTFTQGAHPSPPASLRGFSLVELLITMVILGIGIMAVAALFPLATKNVNKGKILSTALGRAQDKIEELQDAGYTASLMAPGSYSDSLGPYVRTWTVQDSLPTVGSKRVFVCVSWPARFGRDSVALATYVPK
jgi:prepilin-type N-terminal cleavage/methylation domain-containing protein